MNRPQAIIIIGNIASGKTTLAKRIQSHLPDFHYICLDDIRLELTDSNPDMNNVVRDREAEKMALRQIDIHKHIIFESTGTSQFYHRAMNRIRPKFQCFIIKLEVDPERCFRRFKERKTEQYQVPPAWGSGQGIENQIHKIDEILNEWYADLTLPFTGSTPEEISAAALIAYADFISKPQKASK